MNGKELVGEGDEAELRAIGSGHRRGSWKCLLRQKLLGLNGV